ncbi:MAG: hypothetical protein COA43_07280 [Robiginitomaculum sp.]|nr:MAG: hypothetical protein COA43_07280 [Robiginitomaculum sp.]
MSEISVPVQSKKTLLKASGIAAVIAAIVSVCFILPAEYNIDPTGVGKALGLTVLSGQSVGQVAENTSEYTPVNMEGLQENTATVLIPAGRGVEYKFQLKQGEKMKYSWGVGDGVLYHDFHGEPKGDTTGYFESYSLSTAQGAEGVFTAPFDGVHGWYWKNTGTQDVEVKLWTQGTYIIIGLIGKK